MQKQTVPNDSRLTRPSFLGKQAIVVGAGMAGLAAAAALADWFERVVVLDRDLLPAGPTRRAGTPQDGHAHGLLVGGLFALEELLPGLTARLGEAGAVPLRINQDLREEPPGGTAMPQRDFGLCAYTMSRSLLEFTLRERVLQRTNVTMRDGACVLRIVTGPGGRRVVGVAVAGPGKDQCDLLPADLVVDASGRGQLSSVLLETAGHAAPPSTMIGIDLRYTSAILDIPDDAPADWRAVVTHPDAPHSTCRAVMLPIEGGRWMLTAAGLGEQRPPADWDGLLAWLRQLRTSTIYDAVRRTSGPAGALTRFGFAASVWRHFELVQAIPDGLITLGDAVCRFNPVYGQGMSVAAKEALLLHGLLAERAMDRDPFTRLGQDFLGKATELITTPWTMAAIPDLAFPQTRGQRPADFAESLLFSAALSRVAARERLVQKRVVEVWHLLAPPSALRDPELERMVRAEMATRAAA